MQSQIDDCEKEKCPPLEQLAINVKELESVRLPTLNSLSLHNFVCTDTHLLAAARGAEFSNVHKLDISHSLHIMGELSFLVGHNFPSLNTLVLSDCGLNPDDLTSLAEASAKSRLPELRHLDISRNSEIQGYLGDLFLFRQKWSKLLVLNVDLYSEDLPTDDMKVIFRCVQSGCLSSLTELRVCFAGVISVCDYLQSPWSS